MKVGKIVRTIIPDGALAGRHCRRVSLEDDGGETDPRLIAEAIYPQMVDRPETLYFSLTKVPEVFGSILMAVRSRNPQVGAAVRCLESPLSPWMSHVVWLSFLIDLDCYGVPSNERVLHLPSWAVLETTTLPPRSADSQLNYLTIKGTITQRHVTCVLDMLRDNPGWAILPQALTWGEELSQ